MTRQPSRQMCWVWSEEYGVCQLSSDPNAASELVKHFSPLPLTEKGLTAKKVWQI
jgi:hypothetical protein